MKVKSDQCVVTLTWSVKSVAGPVVVVSFIKGQPDVCGSTRGLLEDQARHVAPQLEGSTHSQPDRAQRQVLRPVHDLVGQVALVPLVNWRAAGQRKAEMRHYESPSLVHLSWCISR